MIASLALGPRLGLEGQLFHHRNDAQAFFDELRYMLAKQMVAPNSPQWFNTGLHWAYGIDGPGQGHYYVDYATGELTKSTSAYEHPQPHACFIQSVADDLVNEGGIMDLWVREARLFKYGSGTGSNFEIARRIRKSSRAAASRRASCPSSKSVISRWRHQIGWHHQAARRKWSSLTPITRISKPISIGR